MKTDFIMLIDIFKMFKESRQNVCWANCYLTMDESSGDTSVHAQTCMHTNTHTNSHIPLDINMLA